MKIIKAFWVAIVYLGQMMERRIGYEMHGNVIVDYMKDGV